LFGLPKYLAENLFGSPQYSAEIFIFKKKIQNRNRYFYLLNFFANERLTGNFLSADNKLVTPIRDWSDQSQSGYIIAYINGISLPANCLDSR
jgi:hypothetical protein